MPSTKRGRGRPKMAARKRKSKVITTRVSPEMHRKIREVAAAAGQTPGKWMRSVIERALG